MRKHKRQKYRCRCGGCIETALGPPKLTKGGRYSVEFAAHLAISKYLDHLPLERQVRIMARQGLRVDSQTLWDQIEALCRHLQPAATALHAHVLGQPVIGADETHWKLMGQKGAVDGEARRWQVWAIAAPDAVSYTFEDSRSIAAAEHVLDHYRGIVMADGYGAYQGLQKRGGAFTLAHCWAHVRRKFVEIEEFFPVEAKAAIEIIGELYAVEKLCPTGPPGDELRRKLRADRSREIVSRLQAWALSVRALPQSGLGKAIAYMSGLWPGLTRFLENPAIPLDNNATERALRGVVVGRKNHYGSGRRRSRRSRRYDRLRNSWACRYRRRDCSSAPWGTRSRSRRSYPGRWRGRSTGEAPLGSSRCWNNRVRYCRRRPRSPGRARRDPYRRSSRTGPGCRSCRGRS
jgi:transposase